MWWKILIAVVVFLIVLCLIFYKQLKMLFIGLTKKKRIQKNLYRACKKENYLIINDILIQINEDKFRQADTIIFGNKYIYVVKQLIYLGKLEGYPDDENWRLYYQNEMQYVRNPLKNNERRIIQIANTLQLSLDNFKSIVALAKTIQMGNIVIHNDDEFICMENEVIPAIKMIEKNSKNHPYEPDEIEKYAQRLYQYGLESEKKVKRGK